MQFKVRVVETISRTVLMDADSEEDAANKVYVLERKDLQSERIMAYEKNVVFVSMAPFFDWPFEE